MQGITCIYQQPGESNGTYSHVLQNNTPDNQCQPPVSQCSGEIWLWLWLPQIWLGEATLLCRGASVSSSVEQQSRKAPWTNTAIIRKKTSQVATLILMLAYCHCEWQYANVQFSNCFGKSQQLVQTPQRVVSCRTLLDPILYQIWYPDKTPYKVSRMFALT